MLRKAQYSAIKKLLKYIDGFVHKVDTASKQRDGIVLLCPFSLHFMVIIIDVSLQHRNL